MKQLFLVLAAMLLVHNQLPAQSTPDCIIPQVESYSLSKGSFTLSPGSTFYIKTKISEGFGAFSDYLGACPLGLVKAPGKKADIVFTIDSKQLKGKPEGAYQLSITPKGITVKAAGYEGAFYALQSLLQMCNACPGGALAACRIDDAPRFPYRGLMFDVVRHFHSKDFILKQIDLMALLKMNRLHMHLTDNEAWRIELDCAPEMAQSGAFGSSKFFNTILGGLPHGFTRTPAGYV
ncbi:MAG: family 20 glycosylhydrolase, partial [Bacteroidales bacterium]|nr:family 20 glycosylhydrolase [Bacteroidales bacterium]